jgi:hypothetical protein
MSSPVNEITRSPLNQITRSPLNQITRRPEEDKYDKERIEKEEAREAEIKRLDKNYKTTPIQENNMIKQCINCENKGYKHMNRHFCSPECAYSHYKLGFDLNPYSKGGKTKKRRTKKTRRRRGKSYKKQQKKR